MLTENEASLRVQTAFYKKKYYEQLEECQFWRKTYETSELTKNELHCELLSLRNPNWKKEAEANAKTHKLTIEEDADHLFKSILGHLNKREPSKIVHPEDGQQHKICMTLAVNLHRIKRIKHLFQAWKTQVPPPEVILKTAKLQSLLKSFHVMLKGIDANNLLGGSSDKTLNGPTGTIVNAPNIMSQ